MNKISPKVNKLPSLAECILKTVIETVLVGRTSYIVRVERTVCVWDEYCACGTNIVIVRRTLFLRDGHEVYVGRRLRAMYII